ncbi:hypothetical protein FRC04_002309 [Tulasnella sp. 424]|nr:hypothetical protein FRC04_002309 [Tulasnella sp. 424]KAG8977382.1 hypothetical protein FRC05_001780 [Tulasnella sp. 425]
MRLSSLLTIATAALVAGYPNPIPNTPPADSVQPNVGRMTNAKRFAMNLPPMKPKALQRGSRAASAPRSGTSMLPPITRKCNVQVKKADDGSTLGYISAAWLHGAYFVIDDTPDNAIEVEFSYSPSDLSPSQIDILETKGLFAGPRSLTSVLGFTRTKRTWVLGAPPACIYAEHPKLQLDHPWGTQRIPSRYMVAHPRLGRALSGILIRSPNASPLM